MAYDELDPATAFATGAPTATASPATAPASHVPSAGPVDPSMGGGSPAAVQSAVGHWADPSVNDPFGRGPGQLLATPLLKQYRGEDKPGSKADDHMPTRLWGGEDRGYFGAPATKYAASSTEYAAPVANGRLMTPGTNQPASSLASEHQWKGEKDERLNYAMTPDGAMHLSDPRAEILSQMDTVDAKRVAQAQAGVQPDKREISRINHSTMVAGGDVAGAGTAKLREGKVEELSDRSGHYKPTVSQTAQVAQNLVGHGVMDPSRSTTALQNRFDKTQTYNLSTQELLSYGEGKDNPLAAATARYGATGNKLDLDGPMSTIAARHDAKSSLLGELGERTGKHGASPSKIRADIAKEKAPAPTYVAANAPYAAKHEYDDAAPGGKFEHVYNDAHGKPAAKHEYDDAAPGGKFEHAYQDGAPGGKFEHVYDDDHGKPAAKHEYDDGAPGGKFEHLYEDDQGTPAYDDSYAEPAEHAFADDPAVTAKPAEPSVPQKMAKNKFSLAKKMSRLGKSAKRQLSKLGKKLKGK